MVLLGWRLLRRVLGKDKVASFDRFVAGKALLQRGLVGVRFAVFELSEPPAARGGVFA
jgi:hypothetical protein